MNVRTALITGVLGQDGYYLSRFLKENGYRIIGVDLAEDAGDAQIDAYYPNDFTDSAGVESLLQKILPDEVYHLAAYSQVGFHPQDESTILQTNLLGLHNLLQAAVPYRPRLFFAGSSEMFGDTDESPQLETTSTWPRSMYGISKLAGFHLIRYYRARHGLFACTGILFNHESPRRPENFVTAKIVRGAARIAAGKQKELSLGNLDVVRDWGYAPEYVEAMWRMLQADRAEDYIVATGDGRTLEDWLSASFAQHGLDWRRYVIVDPSLLRPKEKTVLVGNPQKIRERLGWTAKIRLEELVHLMSEGPPIE
jgi:GDPmannose 4,6-dehydratase